MDSCKIILVVLLAKRFVKIIHIKCNYFRIRAEPKSASSFCAFSSLLGTDSISPIVSAGFLSFIS